MRALSKTVSLGALLVLASAVGSCGGTNPFRARSQPPPVPASDVEHQGRSPLDTLGIAQDDDFVVRVVAHGIACSGTLIQDDQVLTAHHCVSERNALGEFTVRDQAPEGIRVELGGDYLPWGEIGVRAVIAPPCGYAAGDGDIAVLVLERHLVGIATLEPRLDAVPRVGERIEPAGFGRCALSTDGIQRRSRRGGPIESVRGSRFRLEASICPGDSGGPATNHAGELMGVVSASVMDGSEATVGLSEFTRLGPWRPVFANARRVAEGASPAELPPVGGCPQGGEALAREEQR
jgi:hypothetical protein